MSTITIEKRNPTERGTVENRTSQYSPRPTTAGRRAAPPDREPEKTTSGRTMPERSERPRNLHREAPEARKTGKPAPDRSVAEPKQRGWFTEKLAAASSWMEDITAAKVLTLSSLTISIALFLPFAADLLTGWPFYHASALMDAGFAFSALGLGALSVHTMREIR